jgi:hypothetical protein
VSEPSPTTREPTHSASSGLPVQMLTATMAIAARMNARLTRAPKPEGGDSAVIGPSRYRAGRVP